MKKFLFLWGFFFLGTSLFGDIAIGRDPTWFPLDLREKTANVNLFVNSLIEKMNTQAKSPISITNVATTKLMQGFINENYQAILTVLMPDDSLKSKFDFSDPILLIGPVLIVPKSSAAESLSDLCGKLIGISSFGNSETIVQKYPSILMKEYENMAVALEDLSHGLLDAVIMEVLDAEGIVSNLYSNTLRITSTVLNVDAIRLVTFKDKQNDLITFFNKQLDNLKSNSYYEELLHYSQLK